MEKWKPRHWMCYQKLSPTFVKWYVSSPNSMFDGPCSKAWLTKKETLKFTGLNLRKWYHAFFSISNVGPDPQKWLTASQKMPTRAAQLSGHAKFLTRWGIPTPFCNSWSKIPVFRIAQPLDVSVYYRAKQRRWTSGQIQRKSWRASSMEASLFVCVRFLPGWCSNGMIFACWQTA